MGNLQVYLGAVARDAFCRAFAHARTSIDAEFYRLDDPRLIARLDAAAKRHVHVVIRIEAAPDRYDGASASGPAKSPADLVADLAKKFDSPVSIIAENCPDHLVHAKAAVIDGKHTLIATANADGSGFYSPGEVAVKDYAPDDAAAVEQAVRGGVPVAHSRIVAGPGPDSRPQIMRLLDSKSDVSVASEDLSDPKIVDQLIERQGSHADRILVNTVGGISWPERKQLYRLIDAHVDVRTLKHAYMHEKYVDCGDAIYVGSANLTRNGLDEAREIGIVAPATDFGAGAQKLRDGFDRLWHRSTPLDAA